MIDTLNVSYMESCDALEKCNDMQLIAYLESSNSNNKFIESLKTAGEKVLDFIKECIAKVKELFESKEAKSTREKANEVLTKNPKIRNIKVRIKDYAKAHKINLKALDDLTHAKSKKEIQKIKERRRYALKRIGIITVTLAWCFRKEIIETAMVVLFRSKKMMEKMIKSDDPKWKATAAEAQGQNIYSRTKKSEKQINFAREQAEKAFEKGEITREQMDEINTIVRDSFQSLREINSVTNQWSHRLTTANVENIYNQFTKKKEDIKSGTDDIIIEIDDIMKKKQIELQGEEEIYRQSPLHLFE